MMASSDSTCCTCCYSDEWTVAYSFEPRQSREDNCEPYEPFPPIERDWLVNRRWLFDLKPAMHKEPPRLTRRILTKPRRRFHLSAVKRAMNQRRAKNGRLTQ